MTKLLMAMTLMPLMALADVWTDPDTGIVWTYAKDFGGTASLGARVGVGDYTTAVPSGTTGALVIPPVINGRSVTRIGPMAFYDCRGLTSVTIPPTVTSIEENAFIRCTGLMSMVIPSNVMNIEHDAFEGCCGLTTMTIPRGVTSIACDMFKGCSGLTMVSIPEGVMSIGSGAFYGCSGLTSVKIPDGIRRIAAGTFGHCAKLKMLSLPKGLKMIGAVSDLGESSGAFRDCVALKEITIHSDIEYIELSSFENCISLEKIHVIGGNVDKIKQLFAFAGVDVHSIAFDSVKGNVDGPILADRFEIRVDVASGEVAPYASAADAVANDCIGTYNVVGGDGVLSVTVAKKGKTKVSGTWKGAKVSVSSQLLIGESACVVPVVYAKKGVSLAFNLNIVDRDDVSVSGIPASAVGKPGTLADGAKFCMGDGASRLAAALADKGALQTAYLPDCPVAQNGTKWVVAPDASGKAAKAGKLKLLKGSSEIDPAKSKITDNMSGLKLTYKAKDGSFKGSFKAYNLENGKLKAYTVNVTGVMVGDTGYGTATLKKPAASWPITIE